MIYQRHIPSEELFSAQLEMLMQNGRLATVSIHLVGVFATILMFWPFMDLTVVLLWAAAFLILLLVRSLNMSNALVERRFETNPRRVYRQLIIGAGLTGLWALTAARCRNHARRHTPTHCEERSDVAISGAQRRHRKRKHPAGQEPRATWLKSMPS